MKKIILMSQMLIALTMTATVQIAKADSDFDCVISEVRVFNSETVPDERVWMRADGRMLDLRNENLKMYALLGASYGGDGIRGFAIPKIEDLVVNGSHYNYYMCKEGAWPGDIAMMAGTAGVVRQFAVRNRDLMTPAVVPMSPESSVTLKSEEELAAQVNSDLIVDKWTVHSREWDNKHGNWMDVYQDYSRVAVPTVVLPEVIANANTYQKLPTMLQVGSSVWPRDEETLCVKGALVFSLRKFDRNDLSELPASFPISVDGAAKMPGHVYECR